jgi:hypothetical protein
MTVYYRIPVWQSKPLTSNKIIMRLKMSKKKYRSQSDLLLAIKRLIAGMEKNQDTFNPAEPKLSDMKQTLETYEILLNKQSELKSQSRKNTQELTSVYWILDGLYRRFRDGVYMAYGKQNRKVEEFGLPSQIRSNKPVTNNTPEEPEPENP